MRIWLSIVIITLVFGGCAPSRYVKPLEAKQKAITVNAGGPAFKLGNTPLVLPLTAITGGYGISNSLTVFGGLHTTALGFGVVQTEVGVVKQVLKPDSLNPYIPGISFSNTNNIVIDTWEQNFKLWPQVDANLYWHCIPRRKDYVYLGVSNWFEFSQFRAHDEPQLNHWIFNPHLGLVFDQPSWNYNLEMKYLAPNYSNQNMVVNYSKPWGDKGGLGIYLSITKKF